jgi:orotidine-5'-phosphate decarboxylase
MASHSTDMVITPAGESVRERLIVALDVSTAREARELVQRIGDAAGYYKVGLQLFTAEGPDFVRDLVSSGRKVFLDLKLHDIPNTVAHATTHARELGASLLTVHTSGGTAMLRAAVESAGDQMRLLAVTILTSMNDEDVQEIGMAGRVLDQALRLASLARAAGIRGVVSSPREAAQLRKSLGEGFAIVTPGVRPRGADTNDQQRVATPGEAVAAGASHVVVGRPITHAADPVRAAAAILSEIEQAQAAT